MGEKQSRLSALSVANLLFCLMVMLLHICSDSIVDAPPDTLFYAAIFAVWRIGSIAVYGFLFLSGLKACMGRRRPLKDYYLRRVKSVVLPYLLWSLVYYALRLWIAHEPFGLSGLLRCLLLGESASHLYFVVALVQFYALIPLWRRMVDRVPAALLLPILAAFAAVWPDLSYWAWSTLLPGQPVYLDRVFLSYLLYWCAGCYAGARYADFSALLRAHRKLLWLLGLLAMAGYLCADYATTVHHVWLNFLAPLRQLYFVAGIPALLALCQCRSERLMRPWAMRALDRGSYQIYLAHMLPLLFAPPILRRLGVEMAIFQLLFRAGIVLVPSLGGVLLWQRLRTRPPKEEI